MAVAGDTALAVPTESRWPELARIKDHLEVKEKPSVQELAASMFERAAPLVEMLERRFREMENPPPLVQVAPNEWRAVGANTNNTTIPVTLASIPMGALAPDPYGQVSVEDRELMEHCLKELEPDILKQTQELIKTEIRDSMVLGGNWVRLKELLKSGAKPRVVRKRQGGRDPLFLVFGDGVETEIEEVRVLG